MKTHLMAALLSAFMPGAFVGVAVTAAVGGGNGTVYACMALCAFMGYSIARQQHHS